MMSRSQFYRKTFYKDNHILQSGIMIRYGENFVVYNRHWHDDFEIAYVVEGEALANSNEKERLLSPGCVFVKNSGDIHSLISKANMVKYGCILIRPMFLGFDLRSVEFSPFIDHDEKLVKAISDVNALMKTKELGFELEIKSRTCKIITHLLNHYVVRFLSPVDYERKIQKTEKIGVVIDYIDKNYQKEISIEMLAGLINVTPSWLCRLFRNEIGKSPTE